MCYLLYLSLLLPLATCFPACSPACNVTALIERASLSKKSFLVSESLAYCSHVCSNTQTRQRRNAHALVDDVMFVVMASSDKPERLSALLNASWLHWTSSYVVVTDKARHQPRLNERVLDVGGDLEHLVAANIRHLLAAKLLGNGTWPVSPSVRYFFFVDDDTFVNVPALSLFLTNFDSRHKLAFGHVHASPFWDTRFSNVSFLSGGAGMLLTRAALTCVAPRLFTPECDFGTHLNDVTLSLCLSRCDAAAKVHSHLFRPERATHDLYGGSLPHASYLFDHGMAITEHRTTTVDEMRGKTCLVARRFGLDHPACAIDKPTTALCGTVCS